LRLCPPSPFVRDASIQKTELTFDLPAEKVANDSYPNVVTGCRDLGTPQRRLIWSSLGGRRNDSTPREIMDRAARAVVFGLLAEMEPS
jgi:hypothetical protein